ncbi:hypothetical protein HPP05_00365 [Corallococcus exiguus]|uniref:hypothetical protein n=1 Tax=Corallococcus exiguus TaxID=83462 RepID=UPI001494467F|nr:hypothetical protein [Corallococcus exiguus]NPC68200.1 hypothetical protein [Corallococcus exiguus]
MRTYIIEPHLISLPDDNEESVRHWFSAISRWLEEAHLAPQDWGHLIKCTHLLYEKGKAASFMEMRRLAQKHKIDINTSTLAQRFNAFFQNDELDVIGDTEIEDVAQTPPHTITPESFRTRNDMCEPHLGDALVSLGCAEKINSTDLPFIVGLALPAEHSEVVITSNPELIQTKDGALHGPLAITARFGHIGTPESFSATITQEEFINNPEASFTATLRSLSASAPACRRIALHTDFIASLNRSTILTDHQSRSRLIRASSAIVRFEEGSLSLGVRAIRTSIAGDAKQVKRSRDSATAWRATITKYGAGWRLHYWLIPKSGDTNETIEFVSILKETDPVLISE